jgi:hypothetical protein
VTNSDILTLITSIISGVIGGVIVAIVNHYLTRTKMEAEIGKLEAETEKIRAETKVIVSSVENLSATVDYKLDHTAEEVIYDSSKRFDPYDFRGVEGQFWNVKEKRFTGPKGTGMLLIEEDMAVKGGMVLNIKRTNTEGRYEVWLQKFFYHGREKEVIPANQQIAGKRKLRVSCEAKVFDGEHSLRFVLKNEKSGQWLADSKVQVTRKEWAVIDLYFQVSPEANTQLRIDNEEVSKAPSSVQIRRLKIAERIS